MESLQVIEGDFYTEQISTISFGMEKWKEKMKQVGEQNCEPC